jgi:transcriptional regulator with XRE-family HTH domain
MSFETIAAELLRALRGRRSQTAFSRRLGYKSNVVYRWESGRSWPTAAAALRAAQKTGVALHAGLCEFYRRPPHWLRHTDPASPEGVATLLRDLRGSLPIGELARRAGRSRFAVSRWLKGEASRVCRSC